MVHVWTAEKNISAVFLENDTIFFQSFFQKQRIFSAFHVLTSNS